MLAVDYRLRLAFGVMPDQLAAQLVRHQRSKRLFVSCPVDCQLLTGLQPLLVMPHGVPSLSQPCRLVCCNVLRCHTVSSVHEVIRWKASSGRCRNRQRIGLSSQTFQSCSPANLLMEH